MQKKTKNKKSKKQKNKKQKAKSKQSKKQKRKKAKSKKQKSKKQKAPGGRSRKLGSANETRARPRQFPGWGAGAQTPQPPISIKTWYFKRSQRLNNVCVQV